MLILAAVACKESPSGEKEKYPKVYRSAPPKVVTGAITWYEKHTPEQERAEVAAVAKLLQKVIELVDRKELAGLPNLVSKKRGLWIDLKTHRTHAQLRSEIENPDSYLNRFYLDTKKLREYKQDDDALSVRDVLRHTGKLKFNFYMEPGAKEAELRLFLVDYPPYNYQLNFPVFIKEDGTWKIFRLF